MCACVRACVRDFIQHVFAQCFSGHNAGGDGGIADYPLCAAEMVADMLTAKDTATCFRRGVCVCVCVCEWEGVTCIHCLIQ